MIEFLGAHYAELSALAGLVFIVVLGFVSVMDALRGRG